MNPTMLIWRTVGSIAIAVLCVGFAVSLEAQQTPQSPYGIALQHMLDEHLDDLEVAIVLDRFPRIDLALEAAQSRGLRAGPRHELVACEGQGVDRECNFSVEADVVLALVHEERSPGEIRLYFFTGQDGIRGRVSGGQRIITLNRTQGGWVIVSDQPGIRT